MTHAVCALRTSIGSGTFFLFFAVATRQTRNRTKRARPLRYGISSLPERDKFRPPRGGRERAWIIVRLNLLFRSQQVSLWTSSRQSGHLAAAHQLSAYS